MNDERKDEIGKEKGIPDIVPDEEAEDALLDDVTEPLDEEAEIGPAGELEEEDDDNPYQNSDEALPDDEEERAITRHPSREGGLFDEI
jgi:hypothetical protein